MSVASATPATTVSNAEVAARLGVDERWIVERTGIHERRRATEHETLVGLASEAGLRALDRAGVPAADVDLVLVATMSPDAVAPNAAPLVASALGARRAGALDVGRRVHGVRRRAGARGADRSRPAAPATCS